MPAGRSGPGPEVCRANRPAAACRAGLVLAAVFVGLPATAAPAQDYSFSVPTLEMQAIVKPDASVHIVYDITFSNSPGARTIDVVDIGTPHSGYSLRNVSASIDGTNLVDIRESEYVDPGFEVHLRSKSIRGGNWATLHVEFTMPDMVFQDTTRADYASLQITPTWFGEQFVRGTSIVRLAVHLPAGIEAEQVLYQKQPFSSRAVFGEDRHAVVTWQWDRVRATGPQLVGVSFPKHPMTRVVRMTRFGLLLKWFTESPKVRMAAGAVFLAGFGFLFFRFSGGTGISVFVFFAIVLAVWFVISPTAHLLALAPLAGLIALNEWALLRRRPTYLPPIAEVEGGGIKRGLTAPEAAALLELPLSKVLTLVLFGLLKKGIVRQVQAEPLVVEVSQPFRLSPEAKASVKKRARFYREAALNQKTVVHNYEHAFLYLLQTNPDKPAAEIQFGSAVKQLIRHVARRMKGFDVSDTQDYYRAIVRRAVLQARQIPKIQPREQVLDRHMEWILMDDAYPTVFSHGGYHYRPVWTRSAVGPSSGKSTSPATPTGGTTSFSDVAASFAGWTENTMGSMASAIQPGSVTFQEVSGGVIDLSGADHATADFFKALGESGSGGGFSGGGCACAGCACACACAGGGR